MQWYHFSDFHIGKPRGPQTAAMASLINAVKLSCQQIYGKVDAVFITGDIAYSGRSDEYQAFCNNFLLPLKQISEFSDSQIFIVPGNHDVNCDASIPIGWDSIGRRNQQIFFSEDEEGARVRSSRAVVFSAYWDFVQPELCTEMRF